MTKRLLTGCLVFVLLAALPGVMRAQAGESGPPKLVLNETVFDFGKVKEGDRISHEFTVKNSGDGPLEIKKVSPG